MNLFVVVVVVASVKNNDILSRCFRSLVMFTWATYAGGGCGVILYNGVVFIRLMRFLRKSRKQKVFSAMAMTDEMNLVPFY